jgi:hypothetical protein
MLSIKGNFSMNDGRYIFILENLMVACDTLLFDTGQVRAMRRWVVLCPVHTVLKYLTDALASVFVSVSVEAKVLS